MSPNRIVALYTPFIFAPLAGFISAWLAAHVPGVNIASDQLDVVFIVGMLIALAMAAQWVHGWQKWEARRSEQEGLALQLATREHTATAAPMPVAAAAEPDDLFDDDLDDFDDELDLDLLDELDDELDEPVLASGPAPTDVGDRPAG